MLTDVFNFLRTIFSLLILSSIATSCSNESLGEYCSEFTMYRSYLVQTRTSNPESHKNCGAYCNAPIESEYDLLSPNKIKLYQEKGSSQIKGYSVHNIISEDLCSDSNEIEVTQMVHDITDTNFKNDTLWLSFNDGMEANAFLTKEDTAIILGVPNQLLFNVNDETINPTFFKKTKQYSLFHTYVTPEKIKTFYERQIHEKNKKIMAIEEFMNTNESTDKHKKLLENQIRVLKNSIRDLQSEIDGTGIGASMQN